jgi:hypothetical protein
MDKKIQFETEIKSSWLMLGRPPVGHVEERFGKREFQHDLTGLVGYFDGGIQQASVFSLRSQQLANHVARDLPGMIGVSQFLALGIGDQLVADPRVEKIPWHGGNLALRAGLRAR